ncbi:hypothetical protein C5C66_07505 [Rathayibacter toxicus]|uniref:Uncharacterized protein n=1 Tax=Rathayibacter toxicus TaxID=145458 RepID=A0A0C5BT52_9MICO|nr:hypothetical protein [Rathayibacter toxicus]AJM77857.1 hypothetical protein TI83_07660 [Rathayibacter toxicus]ALS57952.1 hypothetical protein APU90_09415 [Rathayibacter toxicus]KKM44330.1 hypothetical protein VT73_10610 [Rathayibacter toxicus]PPG20363.1 hypothetical protein C5D15_07505 [Rathayibacter toxicus]PPG45464.1 hypothetical protein C5D16_07470 [Rathayibacter toxicus]
MFALDDDLYPACLPARLSLLGAAALVALLPTGLALLVTGIFFLLQPDFGSVFLLVSAGGMVPGSVVFVLPLALLGVRVCATSHGRSARFRPFLLVGIGWCATLLIIPICAILEIGIREGRLNPSDFTAPVLLGPMILFAVPVWLPTLCLSLFLVRGRVRVISAGRR